MKEQCRAIRSFNRFELKYLIDLGQAARIKRALEPYMEPDPYGGGAGRYRVTSLYYDSSDLRCYREKMDGLRVRRKLRIRRYDSSEPFTELTPVFLEIKQRVDRVTQKRRLRLPYAGALQLCNDRDLPEHDSQDRLFTEEVLFFLWTYNLRPVSLVSYDRQAWNGTMYDPGLRVTFDSSLSCRPHPLQLHEDHPGYPMLPASQVVLEIKVNDRLPSWLAKLIARNNLGMVRISKYCRSIETAGSFHSGINSMPLAPSAREMLSTVPAVYSDMPRAMMLKEGQGDY